LDAWLQREKGVRLKEARRPLILEALEACQPSSLAPPCSRPPGVDAPEHVSAANGSALSAPDGGGGKGVEGDSGDRAALSREELNERLWLACELGNKEVAAEAIAEGADVTSCDQLGFTALHYAASNNQIALLQLLLQEPGVNASAADDSGVTPLMVAASKGFTLAVEYLLVVGQRDVNARERCEGFTALHLAAANNHAESAARLYLYGADLAVRDFSGRDPETCARELGHVKTARRLDLLQHYDAEADQSLRDFQRSVSAPHITYDSPLAQSFSLAVRFSQTHVIWRSVPLLHCCSPPQTRQLAGKSTPPTNPRTAAARAGCPLARSSARPR